MTHRCDVFLSYSRNDLQVAAALRAELQRGGLSVFKDDDSIRAGDLWLDRLQAAIDGCGSFVVLVGRDGVGHRIGAETQAALNRYFGPHEDAQRLPIFGDAEALARHIEALAASPALLETWSRRARQTFDRRFHEDVGIAAFDRLLTDLRRPVQSGTPGVTDSGMLTTVDG